MGGEIKALLSTFTEHISQNYGIWGAKSMVQVRISQLNALTKSPAPTHTLTLVALATDKCGLFFFLNETNAPK